MKGLHPIGGFSIVFALDFRMLRIRLEGAGFGNLFGLLHFYTFSIIPWT